MCALNRYPLANALNGEMKAKRNTATAPAKIEWLASLSEGKKVTDKSKRAKD